MVISYKSTALLTVCLLVFLYCSVFWLDAASGIMAGAGAASGGIVHIVLFSFKSDVDEAVVNQLCDHMVALKDKCLHPTSSRPYIKSLTGGLDNSPEGVQGGITHAFVVVFDNQQDRDYYVNHDPVHTVFKEFAAKVVDKVQVIDYAPGVFQR